MKITIEFKETARGDIEVEYFSTGLKEATPRERQYAGGFYGVIKCAIPIIGKACGAQKAIDMGKPENG